MTNGQDPWNRHARGDQSLFGLLRTLFRQISGEEDAPQSGGGKSSAWPVVAALGALLLLWFCYDSIYIIDEVEKGVVRRFGAYTMTIGPGLNVRFPRPIERVTRVKVAQVRSFSHKATMLTQDENIVDVEVAVQWQISDPVRYLFNVNDPNDTLRQAAATAVRSVIGKSKLDFVLTEGRSVISQRQSDLIQSILDDYEIGIRVVGVEMQPAKPPEAVKSAFDEAIKAREDEQRYVNEAEAYRNEIIPKARGESARLISEAKGYEESVVARATGEATRFEKLLREYERAPEVTRTRLYIDAVEEFLRNNNKILLDAEGKNSLIYLPIDRMLQLSERSSSTVQSKP